ncbi:hypothetical protein STW0522ENT60_36660 [Enterobacter kobei]|nr:hypothetical protein STW0522ENT60_36660 [Enterobacter kobei]
MDIPFLSCNLSLISYINVSSHAKKQHIKVYGQHNFDALSYNL